MKNLTEAAILQLLDDKEKLLYITHMNGVRKKKGTCYLFALLLGGVGGHHFYLENPAGGIIALVFCWTFIPLFWTLIELFIIPTYVDAFNQRKANQFYKALKPQQPEKKEVPLEEVEQPPQQEDRFGRLRS